MRFLVSGFLFLVTGFVVFGDLPTTSGEVRAARLNDIPGTAHVVTNVVLPDVAAIVTNEVAGGWGEWEFHSDHAELNALLAANKSTVELVVDDAGNATWHITSPQFDDFMGGGEWCCQATENMTYMRAPGIYLVKKWDEIHGDYIYSMAEVYGIRERKPARNALGLATLKDIEQLPTASAVTNIVRDNIGTIWDASLGVAWQARMHNGHLYYIAATNQPPEVK